MHTMYYIGLDVHKRTVSYCVKAASGRVYAEGSLPATRLDLDRWKSSNRTSRRPTALRYSESCCQGSL